MVQACDAKKGALCRTEGDGDGSTRKTGRPKRKWLDRVREDKIIREKRLSGTKCTTELHGGV